MLVLDPNHLYQAGMCGAAPGGAIAVARILGDVRNEMNWMVSMTEAALDQADAAEDNGGCDSAEWKRAVNIGRQIRDLLAVNAQKLGKVEERLMRYADALKHADDHAIVGAREMGLQG